MNSPLIYKSSSRQPGRRNSFSYRWLYVSTGLAIIGTAIGLYYRSSSFEEEAAAIEKQVAILSELQTISMKLKAIGTEYWTAQANQGYLDDLQSEAATTFRVRLAQLEMLSKPPERKDYFSHDMESKLALLSEAWRGAQYNLGRPGHAKSSQGLKVMQTSLDRLFSHCAYLLKDTLDARSTNQTNRSWLKSIFVVGLFALALLMLWFLWSATNNRMEILALNMMLEHRVEERTTELEEINLHLSNVQSSICSALIVVDPHDRVITWNPAAERMFGITQQRAEAQHIFSFSPITQIQKFRAELTRAQQSSQSVFIKEFRMTDAQGKVRHGNASFVPLQGSLSEPNGVVILIDDITATVHARHELSERAEEIVKTNNVLKRVNKDLEQFVYAASNDLRSPLVNMHGLTRKLHQACEQVRETVGQEATDSPEDLRSVRGVLDHDIPKMISRMNNSIGKFGSLIDGLLRLSRTGREEYTKTELDMDQEVARVVELFASTIEEKEVQIYVDDLPPAHGDAEAVSKVLSNLMDNALNYLDPDRPGEILIEGEQLDDSLCKYCVRDNGVGIKKNDLERAFQIFRRLSPQQCRGEGLGLAIARKVIERHGGELWLESEWGRGTTFYFTLPAARKARKLMEA